MMDEIITDVAPVFPLPPGIGAFMPFWWLMVFVMWLFDQGRTCCG
jgi:hypothetical protein